MRHIFLRFVLLLGVAASSENLLAVSFQIQLKDDGAPVLQAQVDSIIALNLRRHELGTEESWEISPGLYSVVHNGPMTTVNIQPNGLVNAERLFIVFSGFCPAVEINALVNGGWPLGPILADAKAGETPPVCAAKTPYTIPPVPNTVPPAHIPAPGSPIYSAPYSAAPSADGVAPPVTDPVEMDAAIESLLIQMGVNPDTYCNGTCPEEAPNCYYTAMTSAIGTDAINVDKLYVPPKDVMPGNTPRPGATIPEQERIKFSNAGNGQTSLTGNISCVCSAAK